MNLSLDKLDNISIELAHNPDLLTLFKNLLNESKNEFKNELSSDFKNTQKLFNTFKSLTEKENKVNTEIKKIETKNNIVIQEPREYKKIYIYVFNKKRNIFLTGLGGTGKSQALLCIKRDSDLQNKICYVTSTTGISAVNLRGQTIHRFSGIKIADKPIDVILKNIAMKNKECINRIKECEILILDEVSMLGQNVFEIIDRVFKHFKKNKLPFGGIQLILSGDFLQLKPVNDEFCFKSNLWEQLNLKTIIMKTPYRYSSLYHFEMLKRIRLGTLNKDDIKILQSRVKAYKEYEKMTENQVESFQEYIKLSKDICKIIHKYTDFDNVIKPTRLYSTKINVNDFNMRELDKLSGREYIFMAKDSCIDVETEDEIDNVKVIQNYREYMDQTVPNKQILKEKAQVILTKNIDVDSGLSNGSRGVILNITKSPETKELVVKVLFKNDLIVDINYQEFIQEDKHYKFTRKQIPLILGFAITIHKSQSMSLDYAIIDLGPSLFQSALGYVALSRVRTLDGILITKLFPTKIKADPEAIEFEKSITENN